MNWLNTLTAGFEGQRTKLAHVGAVLIALAGFVGALPCERCLAAAAALLAVGGFFQRVATANSETRIVDLLRSLGGGTAPVPVPPPSPPATGFPRIAMLLALVALLCFALPGHSQDRPPVPTSMQLTAPTRSWFFNADGSCVQCSIGLAGVHANDVNAASLLWDSPYGSAVRGGSWPSRVEAYCDARGIRAWSVTAASVDDTIPWMVWAAKTGRFAAIGAGRSHFQTLYGFEPHHPQPWLVCNNQTPQRIDRYSEADFRRLHAASGPWVVILERASSDPPQPLKWWE